MKKIILSIILVLLSWHIAISAVKYSFLKETINIDGLSYQIKSSTITVFLKYINWKSPNNLDIYMASTLSSNDESLLNSIVLRHAGECYCCPNFEPATYCNSLDVVGVIKSTGITDGINFFTAENVCKVTKTLYVDKNRTDYYIENGSTVKPYKSFANLLASIVPPGATIKVSPGYYSEDVDLTGLSEVTIMGDNTRSGDGTRIQGTVVISGTNTKVNLTGIRIQPITDKIALDYIDGDNCIFQDCVFRNHTLGATSPLIRIGDVVSGGGVGINTPNFYNCNIFKDAGNIVVQGSNLAIISFIGGFVDADISMIGAYGVLLNNVSGSSDITHNISVLGIYRSQIGSLTSAITATPLNAFISLNQTTLRENDGITVGTITLNGTCPYLLGICDYNINASTFGSGARLYNSFDRDIQNTSSVSGATLKDALEILDLTKFSISGGIITGDLNMDGNVITNVSTITYASAVHIPEIGAHSVTFDDGSYVSSNIYYSTANETESTTTNPDYILKVRLGTITLNAGDYKLDWSCEIANSIANKDVNVRLQQNGSIIINECDGASDNTSDFVITGSFKILENLNTDQYWFDLDFKKGTQGTAQIRRARLFLRRIK